MVFHSQLYNSFNCVLWHCFNLSSVFCQRSIEYMARSFLNVSAFMPSKIGCNRHYQKTPSMDRNEVIDLTRGNQLKSKKRCFFFLFFKYLAICSFLLFTNSPISKRCRSLHSNIRETPIVLVIF